MNNVGSKYNFEEENKYEFSTKKIKGINVIIN